MSISLFSLFDDTKLREDIYHLRTSSNHHLGIPFLYFWKPTKPFNTSAEYGAYSAVFGPGALNVDFAF